MVQQKARVLIKNRQARIWSDLRVIRRMARSILDGLGLSNPEISILLLDDVQITTLNQHYLSRNYATDVLSFPMAGGPYPAINPHLLGDVVISVETALRQAQARNCSLQMEIASLLIHGILHLLGYDHQCSAAERMKMRRLEKKLVQRLGDEGIIRSL